MVKRAIYKRSHPFKRRTSERCHIHSCVCRRRNAFHLLRSARMSTFRPPPRRCYSTECDSVHTGAEMFETPGTYLLFGTEPKCCSTVDQHLYSSAVTCQTGRTKKGPNKRVPLLHRRIFLYLFPTFSWMSLRFLRTWLREIGKGVESFRSSVQRCSQIRETV